MKTTWEAYGGTTLISAGKRSNGKPRSVLAIQILVCMTESDAKAVMKAHPQLKFVKRARTK